MTTTARRVPGRTPQVIDELARPGRLSMLWSTELLDTPAEEAFDRWTSWLSEAVDAPAAVLSLVDDRRQYFKSRSGPDVAADDPSETPAEGSFCQYVVATSSPLVINDARADPQLAAHDVVHALDTVAYAGMPVGVDGETLGALCVTDGTAREWTDAQLTLLRHAAAAVSAELSLRSSAVRLARAQRLVAAQARVHELIASRAPLDRILDEIVVHVGRELPGVAVCVTDAEPANGSWHTPLYDGDGRIVGWLVAHVEDDHELDDDEVRLLADTAHVATIAITRQRTHEQLAYRATHDPVTGLPNRTLLMDRLTSAMSRAHRSGRSIALLFADLDRFKLVNDSLGHEVGDELLAAVARRLAAVVRASDTVVRFGGDEFVILAEEIGDVGDAAALADRLLQGLKTPVETVSGRIFSVTASVGIALLDHDGDVHQAISAADAAMYAAKRAGGGRASIYDAGLLEHATQRLALDNDLRAAIGSAQLHVALQPIVALDSARPLGVEALARWDHPTIGAVPPDRFVPVAEETGIIIELGERILRDACSAVARLSAALAVQLSVSVNLSPRQLVDAELVTRVMDALSAADLRADRLTLEITESALLDATTSTRATLGALRDAGCRIALDDFGTGYSSLYSLREHQIDIVKIDRSFVDGVTTDPDAAAIVSAIIAMAHALGATVVAEGVEDMATLECLRTLGCDDAQGYLLSRPLPESEVLPALAALHPRRGEEGKPPGLRPLRTLPR